MTLPESEQLMTDLIKLSVDGRNKINYLSNRRGLPCWENEQTPAQVLEEFIVKLEHILSQQPIPAHITPTRQIRTLIHQCTGKPREMPMSRI